MSANPVSGYTSVRIAAGTSPPSSRSSAFVWPSLSSTAAPAAAIAVFTLPLDAECLSSIATSLPARSDIDLMSGRAMTRATRSLLPCDADAAFSASRNAITCSATTVAAVTCRCIALVLELAAAPASGDGAATNLASDFASALPAGSNRACSERGDSGTRKILKPAMSGNHSAASADANVRTAADTSPLSSRSTAFVCPSLNWAATAPAAAIAVLTLPLDADRPSSIAMSLPLKADTDLMCGRAISRATR